MTPDQAFERWFATLRDPRSRKRTGHLESTHIPHCRCFLGHACHALRAHRFTATVDQQPNVFYGRRYHPFGSLLLPPEIARLLDITRTGRFRTPLPMRTFDATPIAIASIAQMNDETDTGLTEFAQWLEDHRGHLLPYPRRAHTSRRRTSTALPPHYTHASPALASTA